MFSKLFRCSFREPVGSPSRILPASPGSSTKQGLFQQTGYFFVKGGVSESKTLVTRASYGTILEHRNHFFASKDLHRHGFMASEGRSQGTLPAGNRSLH